MNKDRLESKLEKKSIDLLNLIPEDKRAGARKILDKILDLKGQIDVEPMEICVPVDEVKERFDKGSYEIIDARHHVVFKNKGGFYIVAQKNLEALCESILVATRMESAVDEVLEEYASRGKDITDKDVVKEAEELIEDYVNASQLCLVAPLFAAVDTALTVDIANIITGWLWKKQEMIEKATKQQDNNPELTMAFENLENLS